MLCFFDPAKHELDRVDPIDAEDKEGSC